MSLQRLKELRMAINNHVGAPTDDQLSMLALETTKGYCTYRDNRFWDCNNTEVNVTPADIIGVSWLKADETLAAWMTEKGIEMPDNGTSVVSDAGIVAELSELREQSAYVEELEAELKKLQDALETAELKAGVSEAGVSEAGVSEAGVSEAGVSEAGVSESGASESGASESGEPTV